MKKTKTRLYERLIRLGDMMGDGLHHESDGKWISKEYGQVARQLGIIPPRSRAKSIKAIDEHMARRVGETAYGKCGGSLAQTRSGSCRAKCLQCGALWRLLSKAKKP